MSLQLNKVYSSLKMLFAKSSHFSCNYTWQVHILKNYNCIAIQDIQDNVVSTIYTHTRKFNWPINTVTDFYRNTQMVKQFLESCGYLGQKKLHAAPRALYLSTFWKETPQTFT